MKTVLLEDKWRFCFADAVEAFAFDDRSHPKMKSVDIIVEMAEADVFVEVKDPDDPSLYDAKDAYRWLKNNLKYKCRDSYLFRHLQGRAGKPILYVCLVTNMRSRTRMLLKKQLTEELPVEVRGRGWRKWKWKQPFVSDCHVVDRNGWASHFPQWTIEDL